jgi:hypothetical protein
MVEAIAVMKATGKAGTIKKIETKPIQKKSFTVTCGWGKQSHAWKTTKDEAVVHNNVCPEHRS